MPLEAILYTGLAPYAIICRPVGAHWPTELRVAAPFISPEGCTISNRRQRLRIMLTPALSCLEGNTSHTRGTAFQAFICL